MAGYHAPATPGVAPARTVAPGGTVPGGVIVVVTELVDEHADRVIRRLLELGHEPVRVNSGDVPWDARLSVELRGDHWTGGYAIASSGRRVDVENVRSVWWRRPGPPGLPPDLTPWEREFAEAELRHATQGVWSAVDCHWVSRPELIERASYKVEQLSRAARLGFRVPRTIVTADPGHAAAFLDACPAGAVYKVLTDPFLGAGRLVRRDPDADLVPRFVHTTLVDGSVRDGLASVATVPCLFQELVPKRVDVRVTVIDGELFAAEAAPPDDAVLDWRAQGPHVAWVPSRLPGDVAEQCHALVASYGLAFGAIDLIGTPDGGTVFLEINPNGQFLFVQERIPDFRMDDAMAGSLIRGGAAGAA